jgi:hypothetical protein
MFNKVLMSILTKDYPEIYGVEISTSCLGGSCEYNVYLLMKYIDMLNVDSNELKNKVREIGRYVISGRDRIGIVGFADRT